MSRQHIRENAQRLKQNFLMECLGDVARALDMACETAALFHETTSPGFVRERLHKPVPPAIPPKKPIDAVLIDGEPK